MTDPMEILIAAALKAAHIPFTHEGDRGHAGTLDFHLPTVDLHIEVKQFHAERVGAQMAQAPNVIVAQGRTAVLWLAAAIANLNQED